MSEPWKQFQSKEEPWKRYEAKNVGGRSIEEQGLGQSVDAGVRGFNDTATFGLADELYAGLDTVLPLSRWNGNKDITSGWGDKTFSEAYNQNLNAHRAIDRFDEEHNAAERLTGQVVGGVAQGAATGGASIGWKGAGIAAGEGAAYGFGSGEGGAVDRVKNAAYTAPFSLAGYGLSRGISRGLAPKTDKAVKALIDDDIPLTPGQIMGGWAKSAEDKATSGYIVGPAIQSARERGVSAFNKSVINKSLKHIGKELPENLNAGHESVAFAQDAVSKAYDDLLPNLTLKIDKRFANEFGNLKKLSTYLGKKEADEFKTIINRYVAPKFSKSGTMTGESLKAVEHDLGELVMRKTRHFDSNQQALGDALKEAQKQLRELAIRGNPKYGKGLKQVNEAFKKLTRIELAARTPKGGVFTPAQLKSATRMADKSARKRASAGGKALLQDVAETADKVLPSRVPDSGTVGRLLPLALTGAGAAGAYSDNPYLQAMGAMSIIGGGMYTKPGQEILKHALTSRPQAARHLGGVLSKLPLGLPAAAIAQK